MIETEQTIIIDAPIDAVWEFAHHIPSWASLMPGLQDFTIEDADRSRWVLKVGAGALVKTVAVQVHVDCWDGPGKATFLFSIENNPVEGGGAYQARALNGNQTEVTFCVRVAGTGPMAPMWEAMGKPLLPKFARAFAEEFKAKVESRGAVPAIESAVADKMGRGSVMVAFWQWIKGVLGRKNSKNDITA